MSLLDRLYLSYPQSMNMGSRGKLPKVADVERETQYGYVFGVSGPGKSISSNRAYSIFHSVGSSRHSKSYGGFSD